MDRRFVIVDSAYYRTDPRRRAARAADLMDQYARCIARLVLDGKDPGDAMKYGFAVFERLTHLHHIARDRADALAATA